MHTVHAIRMATHKTVQPIHSKRTRARAIRATGYSLLIRSTYEIQVHTWVTITIKSTDAGSAGAQNDRYARGVEHYYYCNSAA